MISRRDKMFKQFLLLFVISLLCVDVKSFHFKGHDFDQTPQGDAIDRASMKFLKEAYLSAKDKNVVASPLGVLLLLSLYSSGAPGNIREEINKFLGDDDYKQLFDSYGTLSKQLSEVDPNYFTLANKIYVAKGYTINDKFAENTRFYGSEVDNIDFTNPKKAAAIINQWADKETKGHIKDPVRDDTIDHNAAIALFNIMFFQGHWNVPFNASETEEKDFHVNSRTTVKKPTMRLLQSLFYHENKGLGARMVELPYKESGFRMIVVLPNELDGLSSVLKKVSQEGVLSDVFKISPAGRDINLEIPKFEIKSSLDLNQLLPKLAVSKLFNEPATDVVKETTVKVSKAFQEAFIKVDEEGATAGAFTGLVPVPMSTDSTPPLPMDFKVDHPFMFLILYQDKIIFAGTYTH